MRPFARVMEIPESQVLLLIEYEQEEDLYYLRVSVDVNEVRGSLGYGFYKEEKAIEMMQEYTNGMAQEVYRIIAESFKK